MSSKKWLGRHGLTLSFESFPVLSSVPSVPSSSSWSSSSEGEEDEEKEDLERPELSDVWGSILSKKVEDSSKASSALYIPPPVKRSKSSLSQKSLEVCTESLGSETGCDGFSFCPSSETEEEQSIKETEEVTSEVVAIAEDKTEIKASNYSATKKSFSRSIPPPLPSLSLREGPGFLMRSHRRDGRLVLEAVPVSSYNYFQAERQDGRLLLSFIKNPSEELMETTDDEEELDDEMEADVFDEFQGFEEEEETVRVQNRGIVKGSQPTVMPCEVINVHRSATTLTSKLMGLTNKNPSWTHSHKKNVDLLEEEEEEREEEEEEMEEEPTQLPQSLPCPPRAIRLMPSPAVTTAAAASFNAYDYFWRTKTSSAAMLQTQQLPPLPPPSIVGNNDCCYYPNKVHNKKKSNNNNNSVISKGGLNLKSQEQQKHIQVLRGNEADCLVPPVRGCKEPRRSLPIWQPPRCIATS
ncbi:hypothetical protein NE237_010239 [Protea cynaroides]|uniref:FAF domain-containing protein n=1 Tax=Protea cynaroides TaxID=273540 RepID=A0A9Q0KZD3_9MAGN|nr:hypothetical protein NE237_010239 [Protea cynaroides]